jgi:hypothetical protein
VLSCPIPNLNQQFHFVVLKYSSEKCKICHGDISLNNIVINRVWDNHDEADEDDSSDNNSSDDNSSDNIAPNVNVTPNLSGNVALPVNVNKNSTSNEPTDSFSGAGDDYYASDGSELSPLSDSLNSPTEMSSSFTTITDHPSSTPRPRPSDIRPYGVTIDNDNSFSLDDVDKFGYRINSVRLIYSFIHTVSNLSLGNVTFHGS